MHCSSDGGDGGDRTARAETEALAAWKGDGTFKSELLGDFVR